MGMLGAPDSVQRHMLLRLGTHAIVRQAAASPLHGHAPPPVAGLLEVVPLAAYNCGQQCPESLLMFCSYYMTRMLQAGT